MKNTECELYPILFENVQECCGCTACKSICPVHAISMLVNEEGFYYPKVDEDICIRCYLCKRICPISK